MDDPLDYSGKVVIVTGGGRGVGLGITERFLGAGADVLICGRNEPEAIPESDGRKALFVAGDVREVEQIEAVVQFAKEHFGRVDVLVNNAGGAPEADAATVSPRFSESIIRLNLIAPLNFAQQANLVMREQELGGTIVNIASVSGLRPSPGTAAYGAAKAGLASLTQSLAVEWAPKVRVNTVTVGLVATPDSAQFYTDDADANVASRVPMGRMGTPADVAGACLLLCDERAAYITGANLACHGGRQTPWTPSSDG